MSIFVEKPKDQLAEAIDDAIAAKTSPAADLLTKQLRMTQKKIRRKIKKLSQRRNGV